MANKKYDFTKTITRENVQHTNWRTMPISDKVKKMSLGKSDPSTDSRTVKQILDKYFAQKLNNN